MVVHARSPTRIVHVDMTDPIQGQGQGYGASKFLKIVENCTFLVCLLHHFDVELKTDG